MNNIGTLTRPLQTSQALLNETEVSRFQERSVDDSNNLLDEADSVAISRPRTNSSSRASSVDTTEIMEKIEELAECEDIQARKVAAHAKHIDVLPARLSIQDKFEDLQKARIDELEQELEKIKSERDDAVKQLAESKKEVATSGKILKSPSAESISSQHEDSIDIQGIKGLIKNLFDEIERLDEEKAKQDKVIEEYYEFATSLMSELEEQKSALKKSNDKVECLTIELQATKDELEISEKKAQDRRGKIRAERRDSFKNLCNIGNTKYRNLVA